MPRIRGRTVPHQTVIRSHPDLVRVSRLTVDLLKAIELNHDIDHSDIMTIHAFVPGIPDEEYYYWVVELKNNRRLGRYSGEFCIIISFNCLSYGGTKWSKGSDTCYHFGHNLVQLVHRHAPRLVNESNILIRSTLIEQWLKNIDYESPIYAPARTRRS